MLLVQVKDGESIERALKKYKRKFDSTRIVKTLRDNKHFTKKSVELRNQKKKAVNIQRYKLSNDV